MHVFESVDEVAEQARNAGFDLEYVQLETGNYAGTFPSAAHNRSVLIDEFHSVGVAVDGTMFEDTCMVMRGHEQLTFNGRSISPDELVVYMPGSELHISSLGPITIPQICIPVSVLESYLAAAEVEVESLRYASPLRISVSPEVGNWFDSSVRLLARSEEQDDGLAQNVEHHVLGFLAKFGAATAGDSETTGRGRPVEYYERTFKLALDYIHANLRNRIAIDELCAAAHVSLRTLQRVFIRRTGMSPKKYILMYKLNAIRKELVYSSPDERSVSEIARSYGIAHMGRFSASYHALFSEYPRETLARF